MSLRMLWVSALAAVGCSGPPADPGPALAKGGPQLAGAARQVATPEVLSRRASKDCRDTLRAMEALPSLPGTPGLLANRAEVVARAKGEPVVFVRPPKYPEAKDGIAKGYRRALETHRYPWDLLSRIMPRFILKPELGRSVLLREGYLYAETGDVAWALSHHVRLEHLFKADKLIIQRGSAVLHATRNGRRYEYADGPEKGKPARLLLFDRVAPAGVTLGPPLHRDARTLMHQLGFEQMRVKAATSEYLVAELRYDNLWIKSLLKADGAKLSLECEVVPDGQSKRLHTARRRLRARAKALTALRRVMLKQVRDQVPFDEPRREWGQQDGHLRYRWEQAYLRGDDHYLFNFDRYPVFTESGDPLPPQVCVDFITETFEQASATYWNPRGQPRKRRVGKFDYGEYVEGSRRQVPTLLHFAEENPEWLELENVPMSQHIPYLMKNRFYNRLRRDKQHYRPGTIVVIRGYAPWDHFSVPHYHTFFVYETDPITSMPILLAGNAGKPRIQAWEAVMSRTPHRKIVARLIPRLEWLTRITDVSKITDEGRVPPLVSVN